MERHLSLIHIFPTIRDAHVSKVEITAIHRICCMVNFLFAAAVVADKISVSIFAEKQRTIIEKNCSMPFLLFLPSPYPMKWGRKGCKEWTKE